ncbi:hypothetical protein [Nocardioides montaniterrae]
MRSMNRGQGELALGLAPAPRAPVRRRPTGPPTSTFRIGGELSRTRGWPAGSEVRVEAGVRPARGDVLLVIEAGRRSAGVFERRFGREVLLSDRGVRWLGPAVEVIGVVTAVAAPLDGMPG